MDIYVDHQPPPHQRIEQLHVWIATYEDGSEGIVSGDIEMVPGLIRHIPIMSSKRHVAEGLKPLAERAAEMGREHNGKGMTIELRTFTRTG